MTEVFELDLPFPPKDLEVFTLNNKQKAMRWSHTEIDYPRDAPDFESLKENEKQMLKLIMSFFLLGDQGVNQNINARFLTDAETGEEVNFFHEQHCVEIEHQKTYTLFALEFFKTEQDLKSFVKQSVIQNLIAEKVNFMNKWEKIDAPKYQRYTAWACVERIFFCTLFMPIFWFRSRGILNSFIHSNGLISQDEILHGDFDALLVRRQLSRMNKKDKNEAEEKIKEIISECLQIVERFSEIILPSDFSDLNCEGLKDYARLMADELIFLILGKERPFGGKCVYSWMTSLDHVQKNSFFDIRSDSYSSFSPEQMKNWQSLISKPKVDVLQNPEDIDF